MMKERQKYNIAFLMHGAKNIGGGEYSLYFLIRNLRTDIFDITVFYSHENEIIKRLRKDGVKLYQVFLNEKITSVYRDRISANPAVLFIYLFYLSAGVFQIISLLKKNHILILHPHDNLSKIIGGVAARYCGVRVITHCRDGLKNNFISAVFRIVYRLFVNRIIAVSEKTKESLAGNHTSLIRKISVIYNGVDLKLFNPAKIETTLREEIGIEREKVVLSVIAVLEEYKGHTYLFDALKKLKLDGINNFVCLVAGDGRERDGLLQYASREGLQDVILFIGYRKDVPALLKITDILVIPSIAQEAFPRVALEAMAMEVSVVCTDFGGLPEAIINKETGLVVPAKDVDAMYNALKYFFEYPEVRRSMGVAGRKRVEDKFSIENNVKRTEELYLDVIKNS